MAYDDGATYIVRALDEKGPLTREELEALPAEEEKYGFYEWNSYLDSAFEYLMARGIVIEQEDGKFAVADKYRPKRPEVNRDHLLTGSVLLRPTNANAPDGSDRKTYIVMGVIAVPKDADWPDEHIVPISSLNNGRTLTLHLDAPEPLPDDAKSKNADQTLLTPTLWRC